MDEIDENFHLREKIRILNENNQKERDDKSRYLD